MLRAIVLVLCLGSAGGIAAYSLYSGGQSGEPVYTVPSRSFAPAPHAPKAAVERRRIDPQDRAALAHALQRELKRVGCYNGEITGVWTTSSRLAMKTFVERVNAALPIDTPDPVLLSLVQGHRARVCGVGCPTGETSTASGACVPSAVLDKPTKESPPDAKPETAKSDADKAGSAPVAGAAAAMALGASAAAAKQDAKALAPAAAQSEPVPPAGKRARKPRESAQAPRPPKLVRDFLKALGIE